MKRKAISICLWLLVLLSASFAFGREVEKRRPVGGAFFETPVSGGFDSDLLKDQRVLRSSMQSDTLILGYWTFDTGGNPDRQGWTSHDLTEQSGCYWHVDDFSGLGGGDFGRLVVLEGNQSLWCGARPDTVGAILCGYATLPGYGNSWDQKWCFECFEVPDTEHVIIDYLAAWDTEQGYDYWSLEYATRSTCDSLQSLDDIHINEWIELVSLDDISPKVLRSDTIPEGHKGAIKLRFRFTSDSAWSDQDGIWDTDGAVIIDSLTVANPYTVFDFEDFEDESPGDLETTDGDWECCTMPGYGDFAGLFCGCALLQEDPCIKKMSYMWAFIKGSTETYACGGFPEQIAVPKGNERGQYLANEIWSPEIELTGGTSDIQLAYDVYRDQSATSLIFPVWKVRSWVNGCPGPWELYNWTIYLIGKDWIRWNWQVTPYLDPAASRIQVAIGVVDMCGFWCLVYGDGECHSHSPLYDNIELRQIIFTGPRWSVRDHDLFNDTFPENGTSVGTGRIDAAVDRAPQVSPTIYPGDSATVTVSDPEHGLRAPEPYTGFGPAVYFYLSVDPPRSIPVTSLEEDGFRWPVVDSFFCDDRLWYMFRMDTVFSEPAGPRTGSVPDKFCIDVSDHYFTNGDTLWFFFGAENTVNEWSYWSRGSDYKGWSYDWTVGTREAACSAPMEMQILPGAGPARGGDILYVDNFSGRGAQSYFDTAFEILGIADEVDRFDKRHPSYCVANSPGGRVQSSLLQLIPNYRKILWNSGDLYSGTVGDGTGSPEKADDFAMLNVFLSQHTDPNGAGIYFSGDDMAQEWRGLGPGSSDAFINSYIPHDLITGSHQSLHGVTPLVVGAAGGIFDHGAPAGVDSMIVWGGCPILNDFDLILPLGSTTLEMTYSGTGLPTDGAVVAFDTLNDFGNRVSVVLSGFSYHYIRDAYTAPVPARVDHLRDILSYLANTLPDPTGTGAPQFTNRLAQNYPNPFNPSTTIEYSIEERAHVSLKIYNVAGLLVRTLVNKEQIPTAEGFTIRWDGRSESGYPVSSGVYFCKLVTKNFTQTKKMILLK